MILQQQAIQNKVELFLVNVKDYEKKITSLMKELCNKKKMAGVFVSVNKRARYVKARLESKKINLSKVIFVDMLEGAKRSENKIFFIRSPKALTELSITVSHLMAAIKQKNKFLIFDSIGSLLMHHDFNTVVKFTHFLISKLRMLNASLYLICMNTKENKELTMAIAPFVDEVVIG